MTDRSLVVASPIGPLELVERAEALAAIRFDADPARVRQGRGSSVLAAASRQVPEYFAGERREFDLALRPAGTPFQQQVWAALVEIPWGVTTTYGAVAARLGLPPGAARAVGAANGANPLPVVVPCHRVVGADGTLTGYAGGLSRKAALLRLEGLAPGDDHPVLF